MNRFVSGLLSSLAFGLLRSYRQASLDLVRIEAARYYVRGVAAARKATVGVVLFALVLLLAAAGFVLVHVGLYALLPPPANAIVLLVLGLLYLGAAGWALRRACAEATWMELSGVRRRVEEAVRRPDA